MSGVHHDGGRHHVTHRPSTSTAWTRAAFAAIVLLLSLAAPVAAGPREDAYAALGRGEYATALRLLRPLADQGDAVAQFDLGLMYDVGHVGQGVPPNYAEARKWYRLAADQGHAEAQHFLGLMYYFAKGVPQDYAEARKWYRLAADQGNAGAQHSLGHMSSGWYIVAHEQGNAAARAQHFAEAARWHRLAADQGHSGAQGSLGSMYHFSGDYVRAHMWLNLSAAQGLQQAATERDDVAKLMTPAQIAEAQKLAREWQPKRP